jgi:hypothetical protein
LVSREQLRPVIKYTFMKSRITIEVDFDKNNQPVIQVIRRPSDDTRDSLLGNFFEQAGYSSRWIRVEYKGEATDSGRRYHLSFVKPEQIVEEIELMQAVALRKPE